MKKHILKAQARTVSGRNVKKLRSQGLLPASVYGKNVKSAMLSVPTDAFGKVYGEAGESGLVELTVDGSVRPVLIHNVQVHPVTAVPLHVEFFQVDLKEKVHANVPLEFTGESPAVAQKQGVVLTILDEIEVEALPTDLPEKITIDTSTLAHVDQEIKVSDLKLPAGVTVLTDQTLTVVKVGSLVTKEAEAEAKAEEEAKAAAVAEAAAAAGPQVGAPAEGAPEGEKPAEVAPPQEKKAPEEKKE